MALRSRFTKRWAVLVVGLTLVLLGCADSSSDETTQRTLDATATGDETLATAPLEGLTVDVHRDPG